MQKPQFIRVKYYLSKCTVAILILLIPATISELHDGSRKIYKDDKQTLIKSAIMKWWHSNNLTKPIECKHKFTKDYREHRFMKSLSPPEIKSFRCNGSNSSIRYYFKGKIQEGIIEGDLEGKGKLSFISDKEWSELPHSDSKRTNIMTMRKLNVCFKASSYMGRHIRQVIGTFKNGSVHGLTKVTYNDNSSYIGLYKNGKAHGYGRIFDSKGNLREAGGYFNGWEAGYHWEHRFGHVLYRKMERIHDDAPPALVFAIASDGSLTNPIAGDYFHYTGTLTNVHHARLINIISSKSQCMLDIEYKLSNIENYTYSLSSKLKYPLLGQKEYLPLCKRTKRYEYSNVETQLKNWTDYITYLLEVRSIEPGIDISRAPEILWQLRPEIDHFDESNSIKLISNIILCTKMKSMTARILGSPPVKVRFRTEAFNVDNYLRLNGFNDIEVVSEEQQYVPRNRPLNWSPIRIAGKFENGVLNGLAFITTNVSTYVWAMVKDGVLHGPCVIYGISYIIDPVRSTLEL